MARLTAHTTAGSAQQRRPGAGSRGGDRGAARQLPQARRNGACRFRVASALPFNYGSVPNFLGLEGDLLDALVLGPRLPFGTRLRVRAWGAVTLTDRGMSDDKLICSAHALTPAERRNVLRFFRFYARCKAFLNFWRRRPGRNACEGWCAASLAIARAEPLRGPWRGPRTRF